MHTILKITGALLAGVLLFFCTKSGYFSIFIIPSFFIVFTIIGKCQKKKFLLLYLLTFIISFIVLQMSFLCDTAHNRRDDIIITIIPIVLYAFCILPVIFIKKYKIEIFSLCWLTAEYIFCSAEIGNQFLQMGIIFGNVPNIIQWYQYTGIFYGSLWILLICYFLFKKKYKYCFCICFVPIVISLFLPKNDNNNHNRNVAIISLENSKKSLYKADSLLNEHRYNRIDYIIMPEGVTAYENREFLYSPMMTKLKRSLQDSIAESNIIMGIWLYDKKVKGKNTNNNNVVVSYSQKGIKIRNKQKMIPFSEYIPYNNILGNFNILAESMIYPLEIKKNETEFFIQNNDTIAPLICYESIFTDYLCRLAKNGAEIYTISASNSYINSRNLESLIICMLKTNAIVTQKSIVRSVENGYSYFISPQGNILKQTKYKTDFITEKVKFNINKTFYVKYCNIIDKIYIYTLILLLLIIFLLIFKNRKSYQ